MYRERIRETLARLGKTGIDPRWVEAWMRLEYGTLDHLGGRTWNREVKVAAQCVEHSTPEVNESLARSEVGLS
jgi:hypothetical protein